MPLIVLWPVVELIGSVAFMAIWIFYAAYTASLGDISTKVETSVGGSDVSYKVYEFDQAVEYRGWFLIFCLFWTLNFITAIGQVRVSCVCVCMCAFCCCFLSIPHFALARYFRPYRTKIVAFEREAFRFVLGVSLLYINTPIRNVSTEEQAKKKNGTMY